MKQWKSEDERTTKGVTTTKGSNIFRLDEKLDASS